MIAKIETHRCAHCSHNDSSSAAMLLFCIKQGLGGNCPHVLVVLVEALVNLFSDQVHQEYSNGCLPLHISLQSIVGASVRLLVDPYRAPMDIFEPKHRSDSCPLNKHS